MGVNLGTLGAMAKGEAEYNADLATAAAENLVAIASINQALNWPEGTDDGSIAGTRASPAIWQDPSDFEAKWDALAAPATALVAAAGQGQAAIGPALGPVGQVCGACHDTYRSPR